jgi:hypothetical protein
LQIISTSSGIVGVDAVLKAVAPVLGPQRLLEATQPRTLGERLGRQVPGDERIPVTVPIHRFADVRQFRETRRRGQPVQPARRRRDRRTGRRAYGHLIVDDVARPGLRDHEAVGDQLLVRLVDGIARHAQLDGQFAGGRQPPVLEPPGEDRLLKPARHPSIERLFHSAVRNRKQPHTASA